MDVIGSIPVGPTTKNPVIAVQETGYGGVLWFPDSEPGSGPGQQPKLSEPRLSVTGMEHVVIKQARTGGLTPSFAGAGNG